MKKVFWWGLLLSVAGIAAPVALMGVALIADWVIIGDLKTGILMQSLYLSFWPASIAFLAHDLPVLVIAAVWLSNGVLYGIVGLLAGIANQMIKWSGFLIIAVAFIAWPSFVLTQFY